MLRSGPGCGAIRANTQYRRLVKVRHALIKHKDRAHFRTKRTSGSNRIMLKNLVIGWNRRGNRRERWAI